MTGRGRARRTYVAEEDGSVVGFATWARGVRYLEVTANPHAEGFYSAAGFVDCGIAETAFGAASRKRLAIH